MLKGLRSRLCRRRALRNCTAARCACGAIGPVDILAGLKRTMISSLLMKMVMVKRRGSVLSMRQQRIEKWKPWRKWSRIGELVRKRKENKKKRRKRPSWSVRGLGTGGRRARADDDDEGRCWYVKGLLLLLKVLLLKL